MENPELHRLLTPFQRQIMQQLLHNDDELFSDKRVCFVIAPTASFDFSQLSSHQESECDEALVACPFVKIGCAAKRVRSVCLECSPSSWTAQQLQHVFL